MSAEFRAATSNDFIFIARMIREFHQKSGAVTGIRFDMESTIKTVATLSDYGVCLVGRNSCAGASITDYAFNHEEKIAFALFWYFRSPREIRIFDALAEACKAAGATRLYAASLFPKNTISRFYTGKGMRPIETNFCLDLK